MGARNMRRRIRIVRVMLAWVVLVSLYMALSLPLLAPAAMTPREWVSLVVLLGYVAMAAYGITAVGRDPRGVASVLTAAVTLGGLWAIGLLRSLWNRGAGLGPAATLANLIALSLVIAFLASLAVAWRMHSAFTTMRSNER